MHDCGYPEKRWLQFLILRVICEKPSCGYDIIKGVEAISNGRHKVKSGTMYTTLRRMEQEELLDSEWTEGEAGPDKRVYKITRKGETLLKSWLEMVIERRKMMNGMVKFYHGRFGDKK